MAELIYRKGTAREVDLLVSTRMEAMAAMHGVEMTAELAEEIWAYYVRSLADGSHVAYLVYEGDAFAGCGGITFYQDMPTRANPTGRVANIMNIYTVPAYRRQGIALRMVDLLVQEARKRDVKVVTLDATDAGRPVYEKYGFRLMTSEMELSL